MRWPFSKTYEVECHDGSKKTVYRNIDDAFPLFIPGWKANLEASGQVLDNISADLETKFATVIHGLLFSLDEFNRDLAMSFRIAYIVYINDPCQHSEFFERQIAKLLEQQQRLKDIRIHIESIIHLAKINPEASDKLDAALIRVIDRMGSLITPEATLIKIEESRRIAIQMSEDGRS